MSDLETKITEALVLVEKLPVSVWQIQVKGRLKSLQVLLLNEPIVEHSSIEQLRNLRISQVEPVQKPVDTVVKVKPCRGCSRNKSDNGSRNA